MGYVRLMMPWFMIGNLMTAIVWHRGAAAREALPTPDDISWLAALPTAFYGVGVVLLLALFMANTRYRRDVRPHLFARTPRTPGANARCRACMGDLPDERGPFIVCRYCETRSLVTGFDRSRSRLPRKTESTTAESPAERNLRRAPRLPQ